MWSRMEHHLRVLCPPLLPLLPLLPPLLRLPPLLPLLPEEEDRPEELEPDPL